MNNDTKNPRHHTPPITPRATPLNDIHSHTTTNTINMPHHSAATLPNHIPIIHHQQHSMPHPPQHLPANSPTKHRQQHHTNDSTPQHRHPRQHPAQLFHSDGVGNHDERELQKQLAMIRGPVLKRTGHNMTGNDPIYLWAQVSENPKTRNHPSQLSQRRVHAPWRARDSLRHWYLWISTDAYRSMQEGKPNSSKSCPR